MYETCTYICLLINDSTCFLLLHAVYFKLSKRIDHLMNVQHLAGSEAKSRRSPSLQQRSQVKDLVTAVLLQQMHMMVPYHRKNSSSQPPANANQVKQMLKFNNQRL